MSASREVVIQNTHGFHIRPTTLFVEMARRYPCAVFVSSGGPEVDGKSPMGLLTLGVAKGRSVTIRCDGESEAEALDALAGLVDSRFGGIE